MDLEFDQKFSDVELAAMVFNNCFGALRGKK